MKANPKIRSGRFLRIPTGDEFLSNLIRYVVPGAMIAVTVGYAAIHLSNAAAIAQREFVGKLLTCCPPHPATANYQTATTSESDRKALCGGAGNNGANK